MTGENLDVYEPVRKKPRFDIDSDSAIMLSTTISEVNVISTTYYTCTVKNFGLFQPVKGCLSCAHVQRSNYNSIKYHISNK